MPDVPTLAETADPPCKAYDVVMLDLDGVVYRGEGAVPHAVEAIDQARASTTLAYVTNNASRPPAAVVERLRGLGVPVGDGDVVTSAQAVARLMAEHLDPGSPVLVVGGEGLHRALDEVGLRSTDAYDDRTAAVVQGFHPDVGWHQLAEATYAVRAGVPWYASNTDLTVPTARGVAPGNGTLVQVVATATGQRPTVAGKPQRPLFDETLRRVGGTTPLVVGDRLDTDLEGAVAIGADGMLVLTGVDDLVAAAEADPVRRPRLVAADLRGLLHRHLPVEEVDGTHRCGPVRVAADGVAFAEPAGGPAPDPVEVTTCLLRAGLVRAWAVGPDERADVVRAVRDEVDRRLG